MVPKIDAEMVSVKVLVLNVAHSQGLNRRDDVRMRAFPQTIMY